MTTKTFVPVEDVSLVGLGAEALLDFHRDQIARAMVDQEEGRRADGDATMTIKLTVGRRSGALRYHLTAGLKLPGINTVAQIGHMAIGANGKPRLRLQNTGDQLLIPGFEPNHDDDTADGGGAH